MREIAYEDYEPELKVWPYMLLALVLPSIPFLCNMLPLINGGGASAIHYVWNILSAISIFLLLFASSKVLRTGEGTSLFLIECIIWVASVTVLWAYNTKVGKAGRALGIPYLSAISPIYLYALAYAFFRKRRFNRAWGINFLVLVSSAAFVVIIWRMCGNDGWYAYLYMLYPAIAFLISLCVFATSGQSESTPTLIKFFLISLCFVSLFLHGDFKSVMDALSKLSVAEGIKMLFYYFFKSLQTNYTFYLSLASIFAFDALARKSCFVKYAVDNDEEYEVVREDSKQAEARAYVEEEAPESINPIQDQRTMREFEEWKEFRRLKASAANYARQAEPRREPEPEIEQDSESMPEPEPRARFNERESVRRRIYGEELDSDSKDKWYELLRGEIPDDEFNLKG